MALIALVAGATAACSSDATRFTSTPLFTNSTGSSRAGAGGDQPMPPSVVSQNGSTGGTVTASNGNSGITKSDLPPLAGSSYSPPPPPPAPSSVATNRTAPAPTRVASAEPAVTKTVKVESGETVFSIARKYNVPPATILKANNLTAESHIKIGQSLVVPGVKGTGPSKSVVVDATPAVRGAPPSSLGTIPANGSSVGATATKAPPPAPTRLALNDAGTKTASDAPRLGAPKTDAITTSPAPAANDKPAAAAAPPPPPATAAVAVADTADSPSADGQQFRWPVRGRIISGFGTKPNGEKNDGINLAVPEGTSVKAAEAGTVIYSGNEIAGYGNLILIRHAGGWVSAYAHNASVAVKRGDTVKRGQTIGTAGATGSVTSPQVHFELRRGSNPVNPLDYLAGA